MIPVLVGLTCKEGGKRVDAIHKVEEEGGRGQRRPLYLYLSECPVSSLIKWRPLLGGGGKGGFHSNTNAGVTVGKLISEGGGDREDTCP